MSSSRIRARLKTGLAGVLLFLALAACLPPASQPPQIPNLPPGAIPTGNAIPPPCPPNAPLIIELHLETTKFPAGKEIHTAVVITDRDGHETYYDQAPGFDEDGVGLAYTPIAVAKVCYSPGQGLHIVFTATLGGRDGDPARREASLRCYIRDFNLDIHVASIVADTTVRGDQLVRCIYSTVL